MYIKAFPAGGRRVHTLHEQQQLVPPHRIEQGIRGAAEHLAADPALLQALRDTGMPEKTVEGIAGENLRAYFRRIA